MGILQSFKERLFMGNVIAELGGTIPHRREVAREFCLDNEDHLLESRAQGLDPSSALNELCVALMQLLGTQRIKEDTPLAKLLITYSSAFIYQQPMNMYATLFIAVYKELELPIKYNPYSQGSYTKWLQEQYAA